MAWITKMERFYKNRVPLQKQYFSRDRYQVKRPFGGNPVDFNRAGIC